MQHYILRYTIDASSTATINIQINTSPSPAPVEPSRILTSTLQENWRLNTEPLVTSVTAELVNWTLLLGFLAKLDLRGFGSLGEDEGEKGEKSVNDVVHLLVLGALDGSIRCLFLSHVCNKEAF